MEDALYDSESMRRFVGIDLADHGVPDESTILQFRHLLERHELTAVMFETVNALLDAKGLTMKRGTIVDATLLPDETTILRFRHLLERHDLTEAVFIEVGAQEVVHCYERESVTTASVVAPGVKWICTGRILRIDARHGATYAGSRQARGNRLATRDEYTSCYGDAMQPTQDPGRKGASVLTARPRIRAVVAACAVAVVNGGGLMRLGEPRLEEEENAPLSARDTVPTGAQGERFGHQPPLSCFDEHDGHEPPP